MKSVDWATRPLDNELGEALRAEILGWPDISIRPMMGTMTFCRGKNMLGCFVNRALFKKGKQPPRWANGAGEPPFVWVRLGPEDRQSALARPLVRPPRLNMKTWIEISLSSREALEEAVRWFGITYERPPRTAKKKPRGKKKPNRGK